MSKMDEATRRRLAAFQFGSSANRFTALQVFEKSKGKCHLCGEKIDPTIRYPHRDSFVRDHIVSRYLGGEETLENSAAAHSRCNRLKSASANSPVRSYASASSDMVAYNARMDPVLHQAVKRYSSITGDSMNQVINQAVASFLTSDNARTNLETNRARWVNGDTPLDEAIKKLSGG